MLFRYHLTVQVNASQMLVCLVEPRSDDDDLVLWIVTLFAHLTSPDTHGMLLNLHRGLHCSIIFWMKNLDFYCNVQRKHKFYQNTCMRKGLFYHNSRLVMLQSVLMRPLLGNGRIYFLLPILFPACLGRRFL